MKIEYFYRKLNRMKSIPRVNLSKFTKGSEAQKQEFVQELGKAFEDIGFVTVENHGIPEETVAQFYAKVNEFFALPKATKLQYEDKESAGQSGYTSFGKEHAKHSDVGDLKEFWQFNQNVVGDEELAKSTPKNPQVSELPEFNAIGTKLYKAFESSGRNLLRAIALYIGEEETYFDDKIYNGTSILRAIYYPPITEDPGTAVRAEEHEDINLITLLVGASAEGLQVLPKGEDWLPINANEGEIVINVGDMLQRLTNGQLKSTTHRVVNPPKEKWSQPRLSIPFFLHPKPNVSLAVLDQCVTEERPKEFDDITAGEYLHERLVEIGLAKK